MSGAHRPVLRDEVIAALAIRPDGRYVDGTYGRGGHAAAILAALGENGRLLVMDRDPEAVADARRRFAGDPRVTVVHDDFAGLRARAEALEWLQQIDGILLDLGVSSPQLDDAGRGFSFQHNGPLDMRMDDSRGQTAADWLARADEAEIARVLWEYGEERQSRRIARRIVEQRARQPIRDTDTLAGLIAAAVPRPRNQRHPRHPATRSFQAIRIHINGELEQLSRLLDSIFDLLKVGGRLLVISFHSLEDRLVKRFFKRHSSRPPLPRGLPLADSDVESVVRLRVIGKPIRAGDAEVEANPRARSAILRIAERAA